MSRSLMLLLALIAVVLAQDAGVGVAQCPIFRFTSNVVADSDGNGGFAITFNPQTSKTLDFVIVHYRSNPNGDWINQRMTSISNSEWIWPLDIDLFPGETLQYWFTYCAERVDCDSPQFTFTVPEPAAIVPPPETQAAYSAPMEQQAPYSASFQQASAPLAPAYVGDNGGHGRYGGRDNGGRDRGFGGNGGGRGYGRGGDEAVASVPYTVQPATVYQSAPVASPQYASSSSYGSARAAPQQFDAYGPAPQATPTSSYGAAPQQFDAYGAAPQATPTSSYGSAAPQDFSNGATIIPSGAFADDGGRYGGRGAGAGARGGRGGYGNRGGYPVIGAQPTFSASVYGGPQGQGQAPQGAGPY